MYLPLAATKEYAAIIYFGLDAFLLCNSYYVCCPVIKVIWNSHVQSNRGNLSR